MALTKGQVSGLFSELLGREPVFGEASDFDADYWLTGHTYEQAASGIKGGSEYQNRQDLIHGAGDAGITEAQLDTMVLPGGFKTEQHTGYDSSEGSLFDFNRGNTWAAGMDNGSAFGTNWATEQNKINQELGISADNNWHTTAPHIDTTNPDMDIDYAPPEWDNDGGYLTSNDLTSWWEGLDKPWLNQDTTSGGMDDFMRFMMFMSMMRPQGGGYGGGQYGYGGLNPGGVQAAYNPMSDIQSAISAFQSIPGIGTNLTNTGTTT
jgi:hypothetical protein